MAWPVSITNRFEAITLQAALDQARISLEAIRHARGNINEIRMLLKGDCEACLCLFKQAVEEGDVISQIQLSQALQGIKWGEDGKKDFSRLEKRDLEEYSYYTHGLDLFNEAYDEAMGVESGIATGEARSHAVFRAAADLGYLPAFLELVSEVWEGHTKSYGFAVQLRPFVGKGEKELDYYFGLALKNGCVPGSPLYYEGLYWMHRSLGITVKCPQKDQSFKDFKSHYLYSNPSGECYGLDGFYHVEDVVLSPSREAWEAFVRKKLDKVQIAPEESYRFSYDAKKIDLLLEQYKMGWSLSGSFIESSTEGTANEDVSGKPIHGFQIESIELSQKRQRVGTISVREDTLEIYETFENPELQPLIDFIETVLKRTGKAHSVAYWLRQMDGKYV